MTRVDFYVLPPGDARALHVWACRLAEKAYRAGHHVYLRAKDEMEARLLDDLLWSFRAGGFVPHLRLSAEPADEFTPVTLGTAGETPPDDADVLINLGDDIPDWHGRFARIAELVSADPLSRQVSRNHFGHYKRQGYAPETHALDGAPAGE